LRSRVATVGWTDAADVGPGIVGEGVVVGVVVQAATDATIRAATNLHRELIMSGYQMM
jgi:hypothetical protein